MDSQSYPFLSVDINYNEVGVIVEHLKSLLLANNCNINHLKEKLEVLHDHIIRYVSKSSSERCWSIAFPNGHDLGIHNLLYYLEICLAAPLSNAESERVFLFLWCICKKKYRDAIHIFLNEYPDVTAPSAGYQVFIASSIQKIQQQQQKHDVASVLLSAV